jgi:hypothetical protein
MNRTLQTVTTLALWLVGGLILTAALILGVLALGAVLIVAPIVLLVLGWAARKKLRRYERERAPESTVYEGEFRVLEERRR